jgi:hypothetical protein
VTSSNARAATGLAALAAVLLATGCAAEPPPAPARTLSASSLRAATSGEVYPQLMNPGRGQYPAGLGVVTYDLTYLVSRESSTETTDPGDLVVAACFTDKPVTPGTDRMPRIVLGVIPVRYATQANRDRAHARGFDASLTECPGTSDTFVVPPG